MARQFCLQLTTKWKFCITWSSQLANQEKHFCLLSFFGRESNNKSFNQMRKMENTSQTRHLGMREYNTGYPPCAETNRVRLSLEPKYAAPIEDSTEKTEKEKQIWNSQLKHQWDLKWQKKIEAGILCGERPWTLCDQKWVSFLYFGIGTEGKAADIWHNNFPMTISMTSGH